MMPFIVFYLFGCVSIMVATVLAAIAKQESHGMTLTEVAVLTLSAGFLWPLLAVALVQVAGLLGLAKGPGLLRIGSRRHAQPAEVRAAASRELPAAA
jgi:hypothetical protein